MINVNNRHILSWGVGITYFLFYLSFSAAIGLPWGPIIAYIICGIPMPLCILNSVIKMFKDNPRRAIKQTLKIMLTWPHLLFIYFFEEGT